MNRKKAIIVFVALLTVFSYQLFAQKKFELADYAKLVNISDPQISPDGKSVVLVVSRPDNVNNRFNAELVFIGLASGTKRVLTQERIAVSSPRWSPNGVRLAFIAKAGLGKDATSHFFLLSMLGGEAMQITKVPKGV